jgi:hypothetical protein
MHRPLAVITGAHQSAVAPKQLPKKYCCYCHQYKNTLFEHSVTDCISLRQHMAKHQPFSVIAPTPSPVPQFRGRGSVSGRGRGHHAGRFSANAAFAKTMSAAIPYAVPQPGVQYVTVPIQSTIPQSSAQFSCATPSSSCFSLSPCIGASLVANTKDSQPIWLHDIGCSDIIVNKLEYLRNCVPEEICMELAADEAYVEVTARGVLDVYNHRGEVLTSHGVYCAPSLKCNLVSWSQVL